MIQLLSTGRSRDRMCIAIVMIAIVILAILALLTSRRIEGVHESLSQSISMVRDNAVMTWNMPEQPPPNPQQHEARVDPDPPIVEEIIPEPSSGTDAGYATW